MGHLVTFPVLHGGRGDGMLTQYWNMSDTSNQVINLPSAGRVEYSVTFWLIPEWMTRVDKNVTITTADKNVNESMLSSNCRQNRKVCWVYAHLINLMYWYLTTCSGQLVNRRITIFKFGFISTFDEFLKFLWQWPNATVWRCAKCTEIVWRPHNFSAFEKRFVRCFHFGWTNWGSW